MSVVELAPVVKTLEVRRSAADCFRMFVHETANWWPLESHALAPSNSTKAVALVVEPRIGGRVYEVTEDGREFDWGEVLIYEPGGRFAMTWQLGRARNISTEVDVRFEPITETSCRVTLTHSHWERLGDEADANRGGYDSGWASVFGERFADYVRAS